MMTSNNTQDLLITSPPLHYVSVTKKVLTFAGAMILMGLLAGILYAESGKKLSLAGGVDPNLVFQGNYYLSLIHGHFLLMGAVLPVTVLLMLWLSRLVFGQTLKPSTLGWGFFLYCSNALVSVLLLVYKAYATQLAIRGGNLDLALVDHALFGANHLLRTLVYAIPHTLMGAGLLMLLVGFFKASKTQNA
jgi:hypothetical protein